MHLLCNSRGSHAQHMTQHMMCQFLPHVSSVRPGRLGSGSGRRGPAPDQPRGWLLLSPRHRATNPGKGIGCSCSYIAPLQTNLRRAKGCLGNSGMGRGPNGPSPLICIDCHQLTAFALHAQLLAKVAHLDHESCAICCSRATRVRWATTHLKCEHMCHKLGSYRAVGHLIMLACVWRKTPRFKKPALPIDCKRAILLQASESDVSNARFKLVIRELVARGRR